MPDFPSLYNVDPFVISTISPQAMGAPFNAMGLGASSATNPTANKAFFIPFSVSKSLTVVKLSVQNGATASGNLDMGIYDAGGSRLVSMGSIIQSGTSTIQEVNIADTVLAPGLYYLACVLDNTTGTFQFFSSSAALSKPLGILEQTSAFVLPATATFASPSGTFRVPFIAAHLRSLI